MEFQEWRRETDRLAGEQVAAALASASRGDRPSCAWAARTAAASLLRQFLTAAQAGPVSGERVADLLETCARIDPYFARLRAETRLLEAGEQSGASPEDLVDALTEVRFLVGFRAGERLGFTVAPEPRDPRLVSLVTHSTTAVLATSIFAWGALYSFNQCLRRGLLFGFAKGVRYLHDPRRYQDCVMFHIPDHTYLAGEKVQHSQRKGYADEAMEDYQPGVRLFFPRDELVSLPRYDDDGSHMVMIRDEVSLGLMVAATFPSHEAKEGALARVGEPGRRTRLAARSLVAPSEHCGDPRSYVTATNELVAERFGRV